MPLLPKAGVGHIAFRSDIMSVRAYGRTCLSLGGHNLGTIYARKLKFGMLFTQPKLQLFASFAPVSCRGRD